MTSPPRWMTPARILTLMDQADHVTTFKALGPARSFVIGDPAVLPPLPAGYATTPVARYRSHAALLADLTESVLAAGYRHVLYEPEVWPDTPLREQNDPLHYLQVFGQLALAHGLLPIMAPARDLALARNPSAPPRPGEGITDWYLRTMIAWHGASHGWALSIQSQGLIGEVADYATFTVKAGDQARAANPYVIRLGGLSTMRGTVTQNVAAALSDARHSVSGWWLNAATTDIDEAVAIVKAVAP